jgi:DNA (cytosine-5)-methyltransferase 1
MTHGSLFSGIGGFDLAAEWMGWENKFHCEWNEFGQKVLKYYWPNSELFTDITKSDFKKYANQIDILTGGFPCQPYSSAGKRLGKEDERHLWPEMLRAIREIAPRYVVGENVRGLTNWNGGLVFDEVCTDLENLGYQVAPFIIPASAVNAPHQRERVWFVAHGNIASTEYKISTGGHMPASKGNDGHASNTNSNGFNQCDSEHEKHSGKTGFDALNDVNQNDERGNASNAQCKGLHGMHQTREENNINRQNPKLWGGITGHNQKNDERWNVTDTNGTNSETWAQREILGQSNWQATNGFRHVECGKQWQNFPSQSPVCSGDDGLPTELDGITFSKWRKESIMAYGNAIVPQVVYEIFKAIESYERIR